MEVVDDPRRRCHDERLLPVQRQDVLPLPELRAGIDCGLVEGWQPDTVFLTHTHLDHSKDLDYVAVKDSGVDIFLPAAALPFAEGYIQATSALNHNAPTTPPLAPAARLHGVRGGDEFTVGKRGAHRSGSSTASTRSRASASRSRSAKRAIKPEFEALKADGRLLAAKRREGVEIDHEVATPLFAFLGDTRPDVFARSPWLLDYPVVVTECTFWTTTSWSGPAASGTPCGVSCARSSRRTRRRRSC